MNHCDSINFNKNIKNEKRSVIVIHGGAGVISKSKISSEREEKFKDSLNYILKQSKAILRNGGTALDAVQEAVRLLEEDELYNAGKGSVFTENATNELDASIMDGSTLKCGAVGGVSTIRNPILAARAVMDHTNHILLIGRGAEEFAKSKSIEMVEPSFFFTQNRYDQLLKAKSKNSIVLDHDGEKLVLDEKHQQQQQDQKTSISVNISTNDEDPIQSDTKRGTVGAVAIDMYGNLAAATSTGGMTNKLSGRVGDTPIIGAGCYANHIVAVSCTGTGEAFIRTIAAYDVSALMEYGGLSLEEASKKVVMEKLIEQGKGDGGIISIDASGNIAMPFNTEGMYRGYAIVNQDEQDETKDSIFVAIYKNE